MWAQITFLKYNLMVNRFSSSSSSVPGLFYFEILKHTITIYLPERNSSQASRGNSMIREQHAEQQSQLAITVSTALSRTVDMADICEVSGSVSPTMWRVIASQLQHSSSALSSRNKLLLPFSNHL